MAKRMNRFARSAADQTGLPSYLHGASSLSLMTAALGAGFAYTVMRWRSSSITRADWSISASPISIARSPAAEGSAILGQHAAGKIERAANQHASLGRACGRGGDCLGDAGARRGGDADIARGGDGFLDREAIRLAFDGDAAETGDMGRERPQEAARVMRVEHAEDELQRAVAPGGGDRGERRAAGGVVAAVEPQLPAVRQARRERAARQMLQPRRPFHLRHAARQRRGGERKALQAVQAGECRAGVVELVRAQQPGRRQVEQRPAPPAIAQARRGLLDMPLAAMPKQRRVEGGGGGDLEIGDGLPGIGALAFLEQDRERLLVDEPPVEPDALVEVHQMRLGEDVDAVTRRLERGAQESDGRALAVGAGDMHDRRQMLVRIAERREQPPHAVERQVDKLGMEPQQPLQDPVDGQGQARSERAAAGRVTMCVGGSRRRSRSMMRAIVSRSSRRGTTMSIMPCSSRYSARWKPSGSFSRMVSSMTRAPAKPTTASGSASVMSPSMAKEAETPPVVGSVRTTI